MVISTTSNKLLLRVKWKTKNIILSEQFRNPIKQNRKKRHTDTPSTQIHNLLLFCLDKSTSIKCGGVKLVVWAKTSSLNEMMQSSMYCAHKGLLRTRALHLDFMMRYMRTCKSKGLSLAEEQPFGIPQTHISFKCFGLSLTEQTLNW